MVGTFACHARLKLVRLVSIMPKELKKQDWQLQTAKARFSEVFRLARMEGPQRITRQGKEGVVMISDEQYARLRARASQPKSIVQFFRESPFVGAGLDLERNKDAGRDLDL